MMVENMGEASSPGMLERRTGIAGARRHPQLALRLVEHAGQQCAAAGEHAARAQRLEHSALAQAVAHVVEELAGARLQHLGQAAQREHLGLRIGDFDFRV